MIINLENWRKKMIKQYVDKFMVWQLHNRREIICAGAGFIIGAIIF
jgi:hypothetical protein